MFFSFDDSYNLICELWIAKWISEIRVQVDLVNAIQLCLWNAKEKQSHHKLSNAGFIKTEQMYLVSHDVGIGLS